MRSYINRRTFLLLTGGSTAWMLLQTAGCTGSSKAPAAAPQENPALGDSTKTVEETSKTTPERQPIKPEDRPPAVISVLMYHHLVPAKYIKVRNLAVVPAEEFQSQMDALETAGYNVVEMQALDNYYRYGDPLPPKPVVITFDDGYLSNYEYALPILQKKNWPFTVFVVSSWYDDDDWPQYQPDALQYMSWSHFSRLAAIPGVEVQSHSHQGHEEIRKDGRRIGSHLTMPIWLEKEKRMERENEYRQRVFQDFAASRKVLEERLKKPIYAFCYPYGEHNDTAMEALTSSGMRLGFTMVPGANNQLSDPRKLNRHNVLPGDGAQGLLQKMHNERRQAGEKD